HVFVSVDIGVDQPSAFLPVLSRCGASRELLEYFEEGVCFAHSYWRSQAVGWNSKPLVQQSRCRGFTCDGPSELDCGAGGCAGTNRRDGSSTLWDFVILIERRSIQRVGVIG